MPASSIRDSSPNSSSSARKARKAGSKKKQKLTAATGVGILKREDENVKESGGVVAAVTKHAAKFSDGSVTKDAVLLSESPPSSEESPDMKPATPASLPDSSRSGAAVSPLLDAVSGTSMAPSTAPSTTEWTKNPGIFAGSPNLISLMGESPPTQPSSYESTRPSSYTWAQQRTYAYSNAPSSSPPLGTRRPISFHMDARSAIHDIRSQASSPPTGRRSSMQSPFPQPRPAPGPPLPHQPQPHFFSAPDIDFDLGSKSGLKAGERGYHFGFDTLSMSNPNTGLGGSNVVLAGFEGGLDVYTVSKRGLELLTSLTGLRGGVYKAKVLPWTGASDPCGIFPLIAVVVHGPVLPTPTPEISIDPPFNGCASPRLDGIDTPQSDINNNQRQANMGRALPSIEAYQTTVEVYSLKTNNLICTLLQAPRIPIKTSISNPIFQTPLPTGALQIHADGGNVVVSSGVTGECWVFRHYKSDVEVGFDFRCVGKLWTTLQATHKVDTTSEEERGYKSSAVQPSPQSPILSISGRWLAYCPPAPSTLISLNASIGVAIEGKAPGLTTLTSPVLPMESTDVEQPISDGVMNRIMRETTQEVIQGARWVGKQGMQLWNNYWRQPGPQAPTRPPAVGSPPWAVSYPARSDGTQFPPTYGISGQAVTKDPGMVSILDLESLEFSTSIHHLAVFKAPLGCSFLSFSPTGLSLFTASSKGDVQTVWDLMRIQHSKSSLLQNSQTTHGHVTRVRQIAQFSRMTVARIVDVAWAKPNGERVAMVTERGTVHLLDMPSSAYTWPPPRRRAKAQETASRPENTSSAVSMASNALSSAYDAALPLINRRRQSASNTQTTNRIKDHASYGGKVLAAGISHSLGNAGTAINQLRHSGENRVSLPTSNGSTTASGVSRVTWITGRRYHCLFVVGDGLVRTFPGKSRKTRSGKERSRLPLGNRYKDFKLRKVSDAVLAPAVRRLIDPDEDIDFTQQDFDGARTLVFSPRSHLADTDLSPESSIPQAEIESSAPYQPFHTDRRVSLNEYRGEPTKPSLAAISRLVASATLEDSSSSVQTKSKKKKKQQSNESTRPQAWAFGQPISTVRVDVGMPHLTEDDFTGSTDDHRALPASAMERVLQVGENEEQIVITTRRRRGGSRAPDNEEDGFFEDDCEVLDFADQRV